MSRALVVSRLALVVAALLAPACSALVNPDTSVLGEPMDAGGGSGDAGARDSGPRDDGGAPGDGGTRDDAGATDAGGPRTDAGPTMCPPSCDDGVGCTTDSCVAFVCQHVANDAACGGMERCNAVMGCVPRVCTRAADCTDGNVCTGTERCAAVGDPGADRYGCVAGAPLDCADDAACTEDACDPTSGCSHTPMDSACGDAIDCTTDRCSPSSGSADARGCTHAPNDTMCNGVCTMGATCSVTSGCTGGMPRGCLDGDPCTVDSCVVPDGCMHVVRDSDMDGYPAAFVGTTRCAGGTDCNDMDGAVHPGAMEVCANGRDDNCNGVTDEGCPMLPDTCATAQPIALVGGVGSARGNFASFASDYSNLCGGTGGRDAVYYIDVASLSDVTIDTIGSAAGTDTVLALALDCPMFNLACNDDIQRGSVIQSRMWAHRIGPTAAGTARRLFIMVDGYNAMTMGDFVVNVTVAAAHDDACGAPIDIAGGGTMFGFVNPVVGSLTGPSGSCQPPARSLAGEAVARFTGPGDGMARFDVFTRDFMPDLYVRSAPCASGTELACAAGIAAGGGLNTASLMMVPVTAGSTAYVFVDGASVPGAYTLYFAP